ncbi:dihydropteroate synthase [Flavihumibacter fluvii]|uniref:dihydropteroate synthase n=1 Tax=Flavihumibacter fluvii TaxID=2838157 RepID=UPI001BDDF98E|nr:dihydropteroate synthase [Flavihumibacter fluvii]ULQ53982.1 dihydropteroate synthase [Flavihumibacter fluvii]
MYTLNCKGRLLSLEKPVVMGILNITPDSFHAPSRPASFGQVLAKAGSMIEEGATILDVGAQSTRPGSEWIDADTEWERLSTILPLLHATYPNTFFSIDTFHHSVAERAVKAGASIVNDVSGGQLDPDMLATVAGLGVPYVCMHMKGTPQTMSSFAKYDHLLADIIDYFIERTYACHKAGISDIIIDPGFGFAKKGTQNFELLKHLGNLQLLGYPILLGVSRKSMVTKTLEITPAEALNGSTVLHTIGLLNGAGILRVHDVKEALQSISLVSALQNA